MKIFNSAITLLALFISVNIFAAPGDDCSTAIAVSSNGCSATGAYDNTGITGTLSPPSCFTTGNNNGMWFKFVATRQIVNITVNGGTLTQPQVSLLSNASGCTGTFTEISCTSPGTASATINYSNLTIGTTYYIYIDGRNNLTGTFQLCLTSPVAPPNDNPCSPIVVPASNFCSDDNAFTNVGATGDNLFSVSLPACWTNTTNAYNTVFFQFTALGPYNTITVSGNLVRPQITVLTTSNCNGTTWTNNGASNCASAASGNTVTMNANNLTAGTTYLIAVDGVNDNTGTFKLCVNSYSPATGVPANDRCTGATPLCPNQFVSGTTHFATSTGDVNISQWNCNAVLDNPVWFSFVANTPVQSVNLSVNGSCSADYLQVEAFKYTGSGTACSSTSQWASIGCFESASSTFTGTSMTIPAASMVAGQIYYVLVDNWPGDYCDFSFTITGNAGANAGANQDVCINQSPFNLTGLPAGGTWSGTGITNSSSGTFNPQVANYGSHTLFYTYGTCTDQKLINVTGPQVVTSNDIAICGGSTQITGSVNEFPTSIVKQFSNNTSMAIPDNNATGVSSVINVSGINPNTVATNPIQKVCLNINHSYDADLDIYLTCPGGTQIELSTDNGGSGDNYTGTCFTASASTAITAGTSPFSGSYTPEQAFTLLNACAINGNWTLVVKDDLGGDIGTLLDWSIYFNQQNTASYVWSPTTNMTNSTSLSPTVSPTATTSYILTATDNNGCIAKDTVVVSIGSSAAGTDQSICKGTSTSFAASGSGTWTALPSNPAVVSILSATNPTSSVGPFNTTGSYSFEWNAGSCKDTVVITVNAPPIVNAGVDQTLTCSTAAVTIGTATVAGNSYTWAPAGGLSNSGIAQPVASQPNTYILTVTNIASTCFAKDTVVISQNITPPVANAGVDQILTCTTTSVTIGTAAQANTTYSWSPATGLSSATIAQPVASQPNTYTVTATNTTNGCTATDQVDVLQNITPPTANAGLDQTLTCTTTSVTIGTAAQANTTYSWSPATGLSSATIAQPVASQPNTYTVTATNTTNGCTATDQVVVSSSGAFPIANAGLDQTLTCTTTSVTIGTAAQANTTYSWSPATGLSASGVAQPVASQPNTYTVTATNTTNGCTATDQVVVSQNITPPVANAGVDKTLTCTTTSVTIGTAAQANTTYSWSPATGLSSATIAQPVASQPNTYTVTATNTTNGCTATDQVVVSQNINPPTANAGVDKTLTCTTTSVTLGTAAQANTTYSWSPATGLSSATIAQPVASQPNTYTVTATNTTNGCTATDQVVVSSSGAFPIANAGLDQTLTCTTTSVTIGTAAQANTTYSWSPATGLSASGVAQPVASQPNTYTVTATNTTNGCTATDQVVISQNITPPVANAGLDKTLTCTTTSVTIGTAAQANTTYFWSPATGLSGTAIAQPNASQPNTYTVTATNTTNGCTATDQVVISQNITPPVANAGVDKTLTCTTTSVTIGTAAQANTTYSWSPATGLSSATIAQPVASQPNTYTVTATNTTNGCTATDQVVVSQNINPPTANAGVDKTLTCTTTSVTLGTAAQANTTYSWSPATGLSASGVAQPVASQPNTYTVTATNTTNGCTATDQVVISQNITPPVANAGLDKTLTCTTTSVTIGTAAQANTTYFWSPATGLSGTAIAQPNASQPNTYTVTATNTTNGCTATDQVVVLQNITPPTANAGLDQTLTCTTTSVTIGTAAQANTTYSWSPATGLSSATIAQPVASQPNTYTVTATNTTNGCTATDQVVVSQNITPPVANAGVDKTLTCTTTSVTIGTAAQANTTYSWSPATGLSASGIAQPVASQPNTYTLTATNTTNGCTATDQVVVSQNITPPMSNAGADKTLTCTTTSVTIGTAAQANTTYSWSPATGLSASGVAQPVASQPNTYTVTATNTTNGCTATNQVVVSQNINPPTANAGVDKTLTCTTTSVTLGTAAQANTTYSWSPATGLSASGVAQPVASQPNTYTVTATNTTNGCTATDQVVVSQNINPPTANAGVDKTLTCTTTSVTIGTAAQANTTYSWSPATGLSSATIAQPVASQPNTYTVTATNTTNGCTATDQVVVSQNINPPTANAGVDKTLTCTTTSVILGTTAQANTTYSWSPATGLSGTAIAQPNASQPNTYTLTATNTTNGCTKSDVVIVSQNITPPPANAGADKIITCAQPKVSIGVSTGNFTYSWSPSTGLTSPNTAVTLSDSVGTFGLTVTNPVNGCFAVDSVTITIDTIQPVADAGEDIQFTCPISPVTIGSPDNPILRYVWNNTYGISATNIAQPTADTAGIFVVRVQSTINGCWSKTDSVTVYWKNCACDVFVPDAFSPNGDGVNDVVKPLKNCDDISNLMFRIFNRWGEQVYQSESFDEGWNGFFKNEAQQMDSYIWTISYHDVLYNKDVFLKGVVTLVR